jgi:hypothetical protein
VLGCVLYAKVISPAVNYNKAAELTEAGEYQAANKIYTKLGSYKDSNDKRRELNYHWAAELAEQGYLDQAYEKYVETGDYKDAPEKAEELGRQLAANGVDVE